jgi:hypothetical protein
MRHKRNLSREAATALSARPIGVAASRLTVSILSLSSGLRPQLRAAADSRLKRATSKSVSEGLPGIFSMTLRVMKNAV